MKQCVTKKLLGLLIVFSIVLSLSAAAFAAAPSTCTLYENMEYLVDYIGQRLAGTPNEDKTAEWAKSMFESYGYTGVEWAQPSRAAVNIGRLSFSDGSGDIYGNALPNTAAFGSVEGQLIDLGTYPNLSVPEGVAGDIVAAVRFNGAPNITNLNAALAALSDENESIQFTGALVANTTTYTAATITGTPSVPCVSTAALFLNRAVAKADAFALMERHTQSTTNAVIATKPAPGGDPDLIIVVSSHMDTVRDSPGASDNGSSVAANLELAKRLFDADLGNIEVRFAVVGSEENGGMAGSVYVATGIVNEGKATLSINLNMDMVCAVGPTSNGRMLNAVSMDINPNPLAFNLPAYLVTDEAKSIPWAAGIDNVRIYRYGSSDHVQFANRGIEAGSMIVVTDSDDEIEMQDHNSRDNLQENYSYERHLMCTNLMENAILKAAKQEVSKRAKFFADDKAGTITLMNAKQLFKTYYEVSGTFTSPAGNVPFTFTPENTVLSLANPSDYGVTGLSAKGMGTADNLNAARNEQYKVFTTAMSGKFLELTKAVPSASVEQLKGNTNKLIIEITQYFNDNSSKLYKTETFTINNNAAGTYSVGYYKVYVDTKGNTQIRECKIVG